jgi:uncharacterized membrane protein YjjP (DUF1212 family)
MVYGFDKGFTAFNICIYCGIHYIGGLAIMASLLALLLSEKAIKLTASITFIVSALAFLTLQISNTVALLVFPHQLVLVWNYFLLGRCMDVIIGAWVASLTMKAMWALYQSMQYM